MLSKKIIPMGITLHFQPFLKAQKLEASQHHNDRTKPVFIPPQNYPAQEIITFFHGFTSCTDTQKDFMAKLAKTHPHAMFVALPLPQHCSRETTENLLPKAHQQQVYLTYAKEVAKVYDTLKKNYNLPIHLVGVSAGATMTAAIAQKVGPQTLTSLHQMAPYYNPRKKMEQIGMWFGHYHPTKHLLNFANSKKIELLKQVGIPHHFDITIGNCRAIHDFAWATWKGLKSLRQTATQPLKTYVYLTESDETISNETAQRAASKMKAPVHLFPDLNHTLTCSVRNRGKQETLLKKMTYNLTQLPDPPPSKSRFGFKWNFKIAFPIRLFRR